MKDLPPLIGRVLSVFVVWTMIASVVVAVGSLRNAEAATYCSQSSVIIGGDWTVSGDEVCTGIMYTMTGNLIVPSGARLELRDGGIQFAQTPGSRYSVQVSGTLKLNNAVITVTGDTLDPYLKFNFLVQANGVVDMTNSAALAFPGWVSTSTNSRFTMTRSSIRGLDPADVSRWVADDDEYDDAPVIDFASSNVRIYDSGIYDLFEKAGVADTRRTLNLTGSTSLIAINSYIGIDFANWLTSSSIHNTLMLSGTATASLLWCTIDATQTPSNTFEYSDAVVPAGGTRAYIYRRVDVTVTDKYGAPVKDATVFTRYSGSQTQVIYPETGGYTPAADVLTYLGRNVGNWNVTNESGQVAMPMISDEIDSSGVSFRGNYNFTAMYVAVQKYVTNKQASVAHWPLSDDDDNYLSLFLQFPDFANLLPDLKPIGMIYTPLHPKVGDNVAINITVRNIGAGPAGRFWVRVYDNIIAPGALMHEEMFTALPASTSSNLAMITWNFTSGGTHLIRVVMDPLNQVFESDKSNNDQAFSLMVTPLGPDLEAIVATMRGFAGNPVDLTATINNKGDINVTGVVVNFYIDSLSALVGTVSGLPTIPAGGSVNATFSWIPPSLGTYTVIAWADPNNAIPEPDPYTETNNIGYAQLSVDPAPNPTAYSDEISASDPYPLEGTSITLNALVRNIGQADTGGAFYANFSVDTGLPIQEVLVPNILVGGKYTATTTATWLASSCGYHTLKVDVDSRNSIAEGSFYESDNSVTRRIQVFDGAPITYSGTQTLKYLPIAQNTIITGNITIKDGSIVVTEPQESCSRVFIKVRGANSRLTLINSTITARDTDNWPIVIYVEDGTFKASENSKVLLNTLQGDGILEVAGNGVLDLTDTLVRSDVSAHGLRATLNRVTFQGKRLHVNTQNLAKIWDPVFQGTNYLALRSDDIVDATADIDLRNATLDSTLTSQLVFGGRQYAQITNLATTKPTRWWEGMITAKAKVTRYWWLTLQGVDGTGALLGTEAHLNLTLKRLNMLNLNFDLAPAPIRGDNVFGIPPGSPASWPVAAPTGEILYRAASEDRYAVVGAQWTNATYLVTGSAVVNGTPYTPNEDVIGLVNESTTFKLVFSRLTPDLSIDSVSFSGDNGGLELQPLNRRLTVTAVVRNSGEIGVQSVWVNFFFRNVDSNNDGLMDLQNSSYAPFYINRTMISVPLNDTALASVTWDRPSGGSETSYVVSAVVDPPVGETTDGGLIKEINELNNIGRQSITLYPWPDLHMEEGQVSLPQLIQGNYATIWVEVRNFGTNHATDVTVQLRVDGNPTPANVSVAFTVPHGGLASISLMWRPPSVGQHTLNFTAVTPGTQERNTDYNMIDNSAVLTRGVLSPPDLAVKSTDYTPPYTMTQGGSLTLPVIVYNEGQTNALLFTVGVYVRTSIQWPPPQGNLLKEVTDLNLSYGNNMTVDVTIRTLASITALGMYNFTIFADSGLDITELDENDNACNVTVNVVAPEGKLTIIKPDEGIEFKPGETITVLGSAQTILTLDPLPQIPVTVSLTDSSNNEVTRTTGVTDVNGGFIATILVPGTLADGSYTLVATSNQAGIQQYSRSINIKMPVGFLDTTIFGIKLWLWLLIIIIAVVVIVSIVAYTRIVGLGKMVECGECGAFIPEDSVKCPKCGVEFEKDMAKCSNCQAWIPLDVKQCPECGVEFATGEVEMADYEQKMKTQYEEVKTKFRAQAEEEIGRPLTDKEFEDWWRRQPTFLTFEDWLREEEEMRKMGSKACPACGTLNSVTATVCHKCGTLLKKEEGKRFRPPPKEEKKEAKAVRIEEGEAAAEPRPTEPVPKKVVVKKPVTPTVIQKKVIVRKPPEEGGEGEGDTSGEGI